ncbi:hypothetical protein Nepgr_033152 [Nepenthes gracilis]|uniref:ATG8-interacting protein 1 n=1 Tax=Nepenthes gracilis TaxID=150966 RepID=A0AAD3TLI5_NEPGR|nr:hypothetical protein Nepgr_033152 [Nepenthes gracilis]
MADNKGEGTASSVLEDKVEEENTSRGNGWEVVSLTASAYVAAPGPKVFESNHEEKDNITIESEAETTQALFMSRHFIPPLTQRENLPIYHKDTVTHEEEKEGENASTEIHGGEGDRSQIKEEEHARIMGLNPPEEVPGVQLSIHEPEHVEVTALHGVNVVNEEEDLCGSAKYCSSGSGATMSGSTIDADIPVTSEFIKPLKSFLDPSIGTSQSQEPGKEDQDDGSELPSEAWWKRGVACLCAHAKEKSAFWSIIIASAVMGLVILGQRWQQERWQVLQQRWQLNLNNEKPGRMLVSLSRFKDIILAGGRRSSYISSGASVDR